MIKRHYYKTQSWIERHRFSLLLFATLMVLILPAFSGGGIISELVFMITMTFLFLQSMVAAEVVKSRRKLYRIIVVVIIAVSWLKPVGVNSLFVEIVRSVLFVFFFLSVIINLMRFIRKSKAVNLNVLLAAINIYLLIGIIAASLGIILNLIYPDAYNFPQYISAPRFIHFIYFSFITMSTVGFGDITPRIPESQALAYLVAITGQLYVAIIVAFLVGKFLVHSDQEKSNN